MPVVLRYEAVQQLGNLAFQSGYEPGYAAGRFQGRQLAEQEAGRLDRRDAHVRQVQESARQYNEGVRLRRDLANQNLAAQQAATETRVAGQERIAGQRVEASREELEARDVMQTGRDQRLQAMQIERIEREAALGKYSRRRTGKAPPTLTPGGLPSQEWVDQEVDQFGHLLPFDTGDATTPGSATRRLEKAKETGESLANLPLPQIEQYIAQRPDDSYTPFLRAIVEARKAAAGQVAGAVAPSVPRAPGPAGNQGAVGAGGAQPGGGLGDTGLGHLTAEQLEEMARNPALWSALPQSRR